MEQNLNPQQLAAAEHPGGPLLIIAGAGSGKTKTLTSRIAHLLKSGIKPSEILAITFTNKSAEEMKNRVDKMLKSSGDRRPTTETPQSTPDFRPPTPVAPFIGTFHSWGARLLRHESGLLGRTINFSIFDDDDSLRVLKEIVKEMDLDKDQYAPSGFRYKISSIKNELFDAESLEVGKNFYDELAIKVYKKYEESLRKNNAFDFDDLITKVVYLFEKHPEVLRKYQEKYKHILVDEYQDVNTSQYRLIKLLAEKHKNLSVVGDDAQAIYAFRGSDFRIFLNFDRDWPGAKVIKLEENYRSTANIITAASHVIKHNLLQKPKTLWTKKENGELIKIDGFSEPDDEAYFIIGKITEIFNNPNNDPQIAILYRTNAQSRSIEQALLQNGIPYRIYGGLKFYDRMEIKDIISALVYANNPQNSVAAERIRKNFNKKEAELLLSRLPEMGKAASSSPPFLPLREGEEGPSTKGQGGGSVKLIDLINFILETTNYIEYLNKSFKNSNERVDNVNELIAFAGTFNHLGLAAFLEQVSLVSSLDTPNGKIPPANMRSGGVVTLMTVHASKGLEFNQVFVVGCNEGLLPHERSISKSDDLEEERRLMYVAMTRAKTNLQLTYFDIPSRFLYEIPQELTVFKNHTLSRKTLTSFEDEDYIEYD